jgi:hypothetical protein
MESDAPQDSWVIGLTCKSLKRVFSGLIVISLLTHNIQHIVAPQFTCDHDKIACFSWKEPVLTRADSCQHLNLSGIEPNLVDGILTWRFHLPVIIAGSLEVTQEPVLTRSPPYLVGVVLFSIGYVERATATRTHE